MEYKKNKEALHRTSHHLQFCRFVFSSYGKLCFVVLAGNFVRSSFTSDLGCGIKVHQLCVCPNPPPQFLIYLLGLVEGWHCKHDW